jgi:LPXTG-motif cell wall-anchored protein
MQISTLVPVAVSAGSDSSPILIVIVIAGVVAVAALGFFLYKWRKKRAVK